MEKHIVYKGNVGKIKMLKINRAEYMYRDDLRNQIYSSLKIGEVSESLVVVGQTLEQELVAEFRRLSSP
jgi:hypothetical protein